MSDEEVEFLRRELALHGEDGCTIAQFQAIVDRISGGGGGAGLRSGGGDVAVGGHHRLESDGPRDIEDLSEPDQLDDEYWQVMIKQGDIALAFVANDDDAAEPVASAQEEDDYYYRLPLQELNQRHGNTIRILAHPKTVLEALTGMKRRPSKLTDRNYEVLQYIARARTTGVPATELGKKFAVDQKTVYHIVKVLSQLNLV